MAGTTDPEATLRTPSARCRGGGPAILAVTHDDNDFDTAGRRL
jgi:hypothetical protein